MRITIKNIFRGCVDIRHYIVQEAIDKNEPIQVVVGSEKMTLSVDDLKDRVIRKTGPFKSKFNSGSYYLLSYEWAPDNDDI